MTPLTKPQRLALKRVFDRGPIFFDGEQEPLSYRRFRRRVQPMFFGDGAVAVQWCGMWLAIEPDGYTHS